MGQPPTLEDLAFGPVRSDHHPHPHLHHHHPSPPSPTAVVAAAATTVRAAGPSAADRLSALMAPLLATAATAAVVVYSISKALEYPELFGANGRNRAALFAVNALIVVVGCAAVAWSVSNGAAGW